MSHLATLAEASGRLHAGELIAFYDRLQMDHASVLAELERYQREEPSAALKMSALLWPFWMDRGHIAEGRARLATALAKDASEPSAIRASALYGAGTLAFRQADNAEATRSIEESLRVARVIEDRSAEARALVGLARCALRERRTKDAGALAEEAMRIQRELGDEQGVAAALHLVAYTAYIEGPDDLARQLFEESLALNRRLGNVRGTAGELSNLGSLETRAGRLDRAAELCAEALRVALETNSAYLLPYCVANIGGVAAVRGDAEPGCRLLGAAEGMFERSAAAIDPGTAIEFERHRANVRAALGEPRFRSVWDEGRALDNDLAIALARESIPVP